MFSMFRCTFGHALGACKGARRPRAQHKILCQDFSILPFYKALAGIVGTIPTALHDILYCQLAPCKMAKKKYSPGASELPCVLLYLNPTCQVEPRFHLAGGIEVRLRGGNALRYKKIALHSFAMWYNFSVSVVEKGGRIWASFLGL